MKIIFIQILSRKRIFLLIAFISIYLFGIINSVDTSLLKINFFKEKTKLYYVNAMNNNKGDLFLEFWGEQDNIRYFIGINATTGEEIYFNNNKIFQIGAGSSSSIYHESIIINKNNEDNIFSMNYMNFDFINIKNIMFTTRSVDNIFNIENKGYSSFRPNIIKLKNNNYLLTIVLYRVGSILIQQHWLYVHSFNFNNNDMSGYTKIKELDNSVIDFVNSTSCFQTEKQFILCSYIEVILISKLYIKIFDTNFDKKSSLFLANIVVNGFTKIMHIKNEIGAFIYFNKNSNDPIIMIKELNNNNELVNVFNSLTLNADGEYTINPGLFYSDAIKINNSKFVVILTTDDLLNLIICLFDIYNNNSLRLRYYKLGLQQLNIKISVNIRAFIFKNLVGVIFYNSNSQYPGYAIFNYPKFISENKINDTTIRINLFINSTSYIFSFKDNIELNNILSEKIKIINFPNESQTGIIIKSFNTNNKISKNNELELSDKLIFEQSSSGIISGNYILEFSFLSDKISYENNFNDNNYDQSQTFDYYIFKLIYTVGCHDNCQKCNNLGSNTLYSCIKCNDDFPYKNNQTCLEQCDYNIYIDENTNEKFCNENCDNEQFISIENINEKYCIDNCDNDKFIYYDNDNKKYCLDNCINYIYDNDNKKYCLSSCVLNNEILYFDEEAKRCYKNCEDIGNEQIYIYQNKCVRECPDNYHYDENNICITENEKQITYIETSIVNNLNTQTDSGINIDPNKHSEPSTNEENIIITTSRDINDYWNNNEKINNGAAPNINLLISNYIKKNSEIEVQKSENNSLTYFCYSTKSEINTLININQQLTYINLKECEKLLIKENNLDENSELLIVGIQSENNSPNLCFNNFNFEIYTRDGKKINNTSICNKIELSSPITNIDPNYLDKAKLLREQGYDIFNKSSNFYYDVCTSAYLKDSDLSLSSRLEDIYPYNMTFCQSGCKYDGVDLNTKRFLCNCDSDFTKNNEDIDQEEYVEEVEENFFTYILGMINYNIFICNHLLFNIDNIITNVGFYIGFVILLLILILCLEYCFQGRKDIKIEYLKNEPNIKEIKKLEKEFNKRYNQKNNIEKHQELPLFEKKHTQKTPKTVILKNNNSNSDPSKKKKIKKKEKKKGNTIIIQNRINIKINKPKFIKRTKHKNNKNSKNSLESIFRNSNENLNRSNQFEENKIDIQKTLSESKKKTNKDKNEDNNINYNELTYNEALKKDKRNVAQIFISLFNIKLELIQITFYPKEFSHKSLTFSLYLFDLLLDLTINSLLFSDDIISQKYFNNGNLKFITSNILSISSNIINSFIMFWTEQLIDYYDILDMIKNEIKNKKHYYQIFIKILHFIELKIKFFYLILFLLGLFCTYYLFLFFTIYKKIQKTLFINYIIGSLWSLAFTVGICLIIKIIR